MLREKEGPLTRPGVGYCNVLEVDKGEAAASRWPRRE